MMARGGAVQIRDRVRGHVAVLELTGRFTVNDSPGMLKEAVAQAVGRGARDVVLDLNGVNYVDSTRLGELIASHVTVSRLGGRLKLAAVPARVVELLKLAGLETIFARFDTTDLAVESCGTSNAI